MSEADAPHERALLAGAATCATFGLVFCTAPHFSAAPAPHRHMEHLEVCVVAHGLLAFTREGETMVLAAGERVVVQRGQEHACWNPSSAPTRLLLIYAPGGGAEELTRLARSAHGDVVVGWDTS